MEAKHTPGPWKAVANGGSSTVISRSKPVRNDTAIPAYRYDEAEGHCIGYPFRQCGPEIRWDFVSFSHEDARLIAAAPEGYQVNREAADFLVSYFGPVASDDPEGWSDQDARAVYEKLIAAIAKAEA